MQAYGCYMNPNTGLGILNPRTSSSRFFYITKGKEEVQTSSQLIPKEIAMPFTITKRQTQ
ncbi:conserved hypothetical protein [Ricinus communis]|uniref:Uncharacterized protein n=1 Tax=Ricinus communis TaxID=3988 RepID=B9S041_RICCO|nr:conserved hypothetical protein [Ricinus communis]